MRLLHKLFREGAYADIVREGERMCSEKPRGREASYCAAIAFILMGRPLQGFSLLTIMLQEAAGEIDDMEEGEQRFWARCALQLAVLGELYYHKFRDRFESEDRAQIVGAVFAGVGIGLALRSLLEGSEQSELDRVHGCFFSMGIDEKALAPTSLLRPHSPLLLQVEPTNHCNMNCRMCPRRTMAREHGHLEPANLELALNTWDNARREVNLTHLIHGDAMPSEFRGTVKLFFMGEPLLHPEIDRLIGLINDRGAFVGIQTNGLLLANDEIRRKLLETCPTSIGISIDGVGDASYEMVRKRGALAKVFAGIRQLHADREALGLQAKMQIVVSSILPGNDPRGQAAISEFISPIRDQIDVHTFINLNQIHEPEFYTSAGELVRYRAPARRKEARCCSEPMRRLNMLWDGAITPCCIDVDGTVNLGHVSDGIDTIWNRRNTVELARDLLCRRLDSHPFCRECLTR